MVLATGYKPLYKSLDSNQKIEYVLEKQSKGLNRKDIYMMMGYSDIKNLDDFMKRKGYIKENDLFVLSGGGTEEAEGIKKSQRIDNTNNQIAESQRSQEGVIGHLATLQDVNIQEKLINMINKYEQYEEMLNWYKSQRSQMGGNMVNAPVVEVVTGLEINYPKTTNMKTSIRLDAKIWSRFKDVADDKFRHIDNPSLLSQALYEFLEKYDK
ncbi:hypothetical protein [Paraclostridium sordellii]|uniref:hypothetical protein n=1 Tax=Paraclostridium sordellii TaxID=1505 RepID=UPI0005E08501|nr:hypothetical protein [Paeniclostridium sordellii]CEP43698.1 Uncharacterised protein [[Clostridium] sordellii] [Paeniclostridium sordellii]CEP50463.1 Uncharacterised protein [[Clostridium] sordellii] [Paeniclostridium sordellii]